MVLMQVLRVIYLEIMNGQGSLERDLWDNKEKGNENDEFK